MIMRVGSFFPHLLHPKDNEILSVIRDNARLGYTEIGNLVGLSRVAVKNRMDLMQKEGVIKGYKTIIEPESAPNGIVPDTFSGSGSTMMACEQTNRVCCTMELDEKYAPVILRRSVENGINPDDIFVERDGKKLMYAELVKEVETK